ncbi:hypothetical protein GCM10010123_08240 [Pilimelia anulata]|uniref:Uncharacterized protein n=1 Tax=Pilimelia anulata TaxID=53371 RepID=A0A8J3B015_9ACTN|nr:hypothetical protein GCM10010123_08240 [Pilimelia anulata]
MNAPVVSLFQYPVVRTRPATFWPNIWHSTLSRAPCGTDPTTRLKAVVGPLRSATTLPPLDTVADRATAAAGGAATSAAAAAVTMIEILAPSRRTRSPSAAGSAPAGPGRIDAMGGSGAT